MCGYLIVVKIVAKTKPNCKYYMDGQRTNMYMLTIYIIHGSFDDIMLSYDLWIDVGCNFSYATKVIFFLLSGGVKNKGANLKKKVLVNACVCNKCLP
jgi:hypothetical protein